MVLPAWMWSPVLSRWTLVGSVGKCPTGSVSPRGRGNLEEKTSDAEKASAHGKKGAMRSTTFRCLGLLTVLTALFVVWAAYNLTLHKAIRMVWWKISDWNGPRTSVPKVGKRIGSV